MDNRTFTIRRLFKSDIPVVEKAFSGFDFLHYNPMHSRHILSAMICGQIWGAFDGDFMVGCTWLVPADSSFFRDSIAAWEIRDLLDNDLSDYMVAGYVWQAEEYKNCPVYRAFSRLWVMQAAKLKKTMVVHYSPRHINTDMERLFSDGWRLKGLRGLDKLVPHYIFVKKAEFTNKDKKSPRNTKSCPLSDTKQLSRLCEQGWAAVALDKEQNLLFIKGDDCFD